MDETELYEKVCKPEFKEIKDDVKEILRVVKGNGNNPGLVTQIALQEQQIQGHQNDINIIKETKKEFQKQFRSIVVAMWLCIFGVIVSYAPKLVTWIVGLNGQ